jgi:hypothetical protein
MMVCEFVLDYSIVVRTRRRIFTRLGELWQPKIWRGPIKRVKQPFQIRNRSSNVTTKYLQCVNSIIVSIGKGLWRRQVF